MESNGFQSSSEEDNRRNYKQSRLFSGVSDDEKLSISELQLPLIDTSNRIRDDKSENFETEEMRSSDTSSPPLEKKLSEKSSQDVLIAAIFLRDYESSRPCSLPTNTSAIKPLQLFIHHVRFSYVWQFIVYFATGCLFLSSCYDSFGSEGKGRHQQFMLTISSVVVFTLDAMMRTILDERDPNSGVSTVANSRVRKTRAEKWKLPTLAILFAVLIETFIKTIQNGGKAVVWTGMFKPIVFFYVSSKARDGKRMKVFMLRILGDSDIILYFYDR
jgi:hypothetical protein